MPTTSSSSVTERLFYLQDSRGLTGDNVMWWARKGAYTSDIAEAAAYPERNVMAQHRWRLSDIPWPKDYIDARTMPAVDMQYIRPQAKITGESYAQVAGRFAGNDVIWIGCRGEVTNDLSKARVYAEIEEAAGFVHWSKRYIDKKARQVIDVRRVDIAEALAGTGIVLTKPRKERVMPCRCGGCGKFIAAVDFYAGECVCGVRCQA